MISDWIQAYITIIWYSIIRVLIYTWYIYIYYYRCKSHYSIYVIFVSSNTLEKHHKLCYIPLQTVSISLFCAWKLNSWLLGSLQLPTAPPYSSQQLPPNRRINYPLLIYIHIPTCTIYCRTHKSLYIYIHIFTPYVNLYAYIHKYTVCIHNIIYNIIYINDRVYSERPG